jgi:hypothetical protein
MKTPMINPLPRTGHTPFQVLCHAIQAAEICWGRPITSPLRRTKNPRIFKGLRTIRAWRGELARILLNVHRAQAKRSFQR